MKRNFLLMLIVFVCSNVFSQQEQLELPDQTWEQLTMEAVNYKEVTTIPGAYKAPTRIEYPWVYISSEHKHIYIGYSNVCEGAIYRIKDANDSIIVSGTIAFNGNDYFPINIESFLSGSYSLEIETPNLTFIGMFTY